MGTFAEANNERRKYTGLSDRRWERARWALAEHIDAFNPITAEDKEYKRRVLEFAKRPLVQ